MQDNMTSNKEKRSIDTNPYKHRKHIGTSIEEWNFKKQPNENSRIEKYSYPK